MFIVTQKTVPKWHLLGYNLPPGCIILDLKYAKMSETTKRLCSTEIDLESKLNITYEEGTVSKMTACEVDLDKTHKNVTEICEKDFQKNSTLKEDNADCEKALDEAQACKRWSVPEWLFTTKHGVFGLAKGWANITGFILMAILIIMVICSLPIVRKSGHFQVS